MKIRKISDLLNNDNTSLGTPVPSQSTPRGSGSGKDRSISNKSKGGPSNASRVEPGRSQATRIAPRPSGTIVLQNEPVDPKKAKEQARRIRKRESAARSNERRRLKNSQNKSKSAGITKPPRRNS